MPGGVAQPPTVSADFVSLVAEHRERIAGLVYRLLGWSEDVEDVVQEVFVAALGALPRFRGECRMETWLFRIAVNQCRRHQRRRLWWWQWWRREAERETHERTGRPRDALLDAETFDQVRRAVRLLPARYREVVVLRYFESLPSAEIGAILGQSPNAVEVRLSRARQHLRASLAGLLER